MSLDPLQAFQHFKVEDARGDYIPQSTLLTALHMCDLNPPVSELPDLIAEIDSDGSGRIEWEEFAAYCQRFEGTKANEAELRATFEAYDTDGNGYLDHDEFRTVLRGGSEPMSEVEVKRAIDLFDSDGDGRIDYLEFVAMVCGKRRNKKGPSEMEQLLQREERERREIGEGGDDDNEDSQAAAWRSLLEAEERERESAEAPTPPPINREPTPTPPPRQPEKEKKGGCC